MPSQPEPMRSVSAASAVRFGSGTAPRSARLAALVLRRGAMGAASAHLSPRVALSIQASACRAELVAPRRRKACAIGSEEATRSAAGAANVKGVVLTRRGAVEARLPVVRTPRTELAAPGLREPLLALRRRRAPLRPVGGAIRPCPPATEGCFRRSFPAEIGRRPVPASEPFLHRARCGHGKRHRRSFRPFLARSSKLRRRRVVAC
jgi:hypothetical protein